MAGLPNVPVTPVNKKLDKLPTGFENSNYFKSLSSVTKAAYGAYDSEKQAVCL
jgi:hypothetical protein